MESVYRPRGTMVKVDVQQTVAVGYDVILWRRVIQQVVTDVLEALTVNMKAIYSATVLATIHKTTTYRTQEPNRMVYL
jgi:hypothetical protein